MRYRPLLPVCLQVDPQHYPPGAIHCLLSASLEGAALLDLTNLRGERIWSRPDQELR
eukprot:COSAG01_NODE_68453_length_264_cov_0.624242_1_plen_56_part_10